MNTLSFDKSLQYAFVGKRVGSSDGESALVFVSFHQPYVVSQLQSHTHVDGGQEVHWLLYTSDPADDLHM